MYPDIGVLKFSSRNDYCYVVLVVDVVVVVVDVAVVNVVVAAAAVVFVVAIVVVVHQPADAEN